MNDGLDPTGPDFIHWQVECAKLAFADRDTFYGDPKFVTVPVEVLLSDAYNDQRAKLVTNEASHELRPGMIASVVIGNAVATDKAPAVPLSAVVRSKDSSESYAVYVIETHDGASFARLRKVTLGDAFGNMIVVKDGLNIGDGVISVGSTLPP